MSVSSVDRPPTAMAGDEGFCNGTLVNILRRPDRRPKTARRRFLVFMAASHQMKPFVGSQLLADRNFDIAVRYYRSPHPDDQLLHEADYLLTGGLSKFHAAKQFIEMTGTLPHYDGFLFLDGDVCFELRDMERLLDIAGSEDFALAQAGLTPDSYYSWEITLARPAFEYRETSFVEVMAPYVSRQALAAIIHTFDQSISSFGLDRVWPYLLPGQRIGVIDAVRMRHALPIDRKGGAFYTYLRSIGIDEGQEQRELLSRYRVPKVHPHDLAGYRKSQHDPDALERIPLARLPYPLLSYSHRLDGVQTWFSRCVGTARMTSKRVIQLSRHDDQPAQHNVSR